MVQVIAFIIGSFYWSLVSSPFVKQFANATVNDCIEDESYRYCYGSQESPSGAWEKRDWFVEIEAFETGITTVFFEASPLYEEVWFLALLGDQEVLLVIDHQRYWSEFSTLVYEWTELVWMSADGTVKQRVPLPFRPVEAIAFEHRLWLFDANLEVKEIREDGTLASVPAGWEMLIGDELLVQSDVFFTTPDGTPVLHVEVGNYQLVWTTRSGFSFTLPVIVHPRIHGLPEGGETTAPFRLYSEGQITLNGQPFQTGSLVNLPGNHQFIILGAYGYRQEINVVFHPYVLGLPETGITSKTIRIYANAPMTLNGMEYRSGTPIVESNRYELNITAANGYSTTHTFLLAPSVIGVIDGMVYDSPLDLTINGVGLLNGVFVEGSFRVAQNGEYELALMVEDQVISRLRFTVSIPLEQDVEKSFEPVSFLQIGLGMLALVGLFLVLKKR
jgi:hypothetical protein